MNWLIYIGGWGFLGVVATQILTRIYWVIPSHKEDLFFWISWTMCWIWICWKFIN